MRRRLLWSGLLFLLAFLPLPWIYHGLYSPVDLPDGGYRLDIARGDTFNAVIDRLADDEVLPDRYLARLWLRVQPGDKTLHPGVLLLRAPQTPVSLLQNILDGNARLPSNRLTVVEGITLRDLRRMLAARDDIAVAAIEDAALVAELGLPTPSPEGWFAPDTYDIRPGESELAILRRLHERQVRLLEAAWAARAPGLPYATPYEALIMASIIEKETGVADERPAIAGVFVRRLQRGMRLQTDPTVIYGMGERYQGRITRADLLRPTPWNTYTNSGLPPTPIALPGRAAIEAALQPAPGDALFFVARGDGTHEFSATLAEHNRAVARYQKRRRADYRSAPPPATP